MSYQCTFCASIQKHVFRCSGCGMLVCSSCAKGGKSSAVGAASRTVAGYFSLGATEVARAAYRRAKQHCPRCDGKDLIRM